MADLLPDSVVAGRVIESPVGPLTVVATAGGVAAIRFGAVAVPAEPGPRAPTSVRTAVGIVETATRQLEEYFHGSRTAFDLPLDQQGTPFQLRVWAALEAIPFGQTRSYGELARAMGDPKRARAVGAAAGANQVPIVVPCHRLVGSDGSLTGFAGGLEVKSALLHHEAQSVQPDLFG